MVHLKIYPPFPALLGQTTPGISKDMPSSTANSTYLSPMTSVLRPLAFPLHLGVKFFSIARQEMEKLIAFAF
jgi:hypothetical protein